MDSRLDLSAVAGEVQGIDARYGLCGAAGIDDDTVFRPFVPVLKKVPVKLIVRPRKDIGHVVSSLQRRPRLLPLDAFRGQQSEDRQFWRGLLQQSRLPFGNRSGEGF